MTRYQHWTQGVVSCLAIATLGLAAVPCASAQNHNDENKGSLVVDVVKQVGLDPTTYAPAVLAYDATIRDWKSSQPFFRNGFPEHNSRFTVSGLPDDQALSYEAGRRQILRDAMGHLQISLVNNVTSRLFERLVVDRYPNHRKLFRTLGWIERVSFASYMSYLLSSQHYRQWAANERRAQELGFR